MNYGREDTELPQALSGLANEADWPLSATPEERLAQGQRAKGRRTKVRATVAGLAVAAVMAGGVAGVALNDRNADPTVVAIPQSDAGGLPQAAAALQKASDAALGAQDPAVGPGEYLKIVSIARNLDSIETATAADQEAGESQGLSYWSEERFEQWVPGQRNENWYLYRSGRFAKELLKPSGDVRTIDDLPADTAPQPERLTAKNGAFYADQGGATEGSWQSPTYNWMATLPRDPEKLLAMLRKETKGRGNGAEAEILVYVADVLRSGIVPADLRAALYETVALLPSAQVVDERANLAGRTGTAIGVVDDIGRRHELIFDPANGQVIGERQVATRAVNEIPAGTVLSSTAVTTAVVQEKPDWAR